MNTGKWERKQSTKHQLLRGIIFRNKITPAFLPAVFCIERSHCFTGQTILPLGRGSQEQGNSLLNEQQHSHACSPFLWLPQLEIKQKKQATQTCGQISKLADCTSLSCLKSNCAFFHSVFLLSDQSRCLKFYEYLLWQHTIALLTTIFNTLFM